MNKMLFIFLAVYGSPSVHAQIETPNGKTWFAAILYYQKKFPGVFDPIETIRLDQVPQDTLAEQIRNTATKWREVDKQRSGAASDDARLATSREANEALASLVQTFKNTQKKLVEGSAQKILQNIHESDRLSLTLIDSTFLESQLGKKFTFDAKTGQLSSYTLDRQRNRIFFQNEKGEKILEVSFKNISSNKIQIRSFLPPDFKKATGTDLTFDVQDFEGNLFNPKNTSRTLLGAYPQKADTWIDPQGTRHYSGDGHKNCRHR
jgi:hypothetical protein